MSFTNTRARAVAAPEPTNSTGCPARGCPCRGSIDTGGGFLCSFHNAAKSDEWPRVTEGLIEHVWLRDFITDLMRDEKLIADRAWRKYAGDFWGEADPYMVPLATENRPHYLYRLHYELQHRVGARAQRPAPFVPQGNNKPSRYGNLAGIIAGQVVA